MAVFKCKMCGGNLDIAEGMTVCECEYCGTKQTLPRLDSDRKSNLYDRANHFRRNNDFDKAIGIYEQILNEDNSDAEAYWSLVLCRYGIEYVEDPQSHKRIPTVNRAQYTSIYMDEDYKSAIKYADAYQKTIYEAEAKAIDDIQKGILEISSKEEPFDVFICYKETDANGRRTQDSVLANDLYHQLTNEGFKVFFSRITLEDKLGVAYEPYIFAALNSAKVMVVLGTRPDYFNAVWVKNEWSRYLTLVKNSNGKKILIPAYREMDPYDLPEEFSHLQAQDMSKLGFMQDLIRGIKKIISSDAQKTAVKETVVVNTNSTSTTPLLERVYLFLEDGKWEDANIYCEKVLDIDPKNADAYLGKLMAELQVKNRNALADYLEPFDDRDNFNKVIRFGDEQLAEELRGYITHIKDRNENARLNGIYNDAKREMAKAKTEMEYRTVADMFNSIDGFRDASALAEKCVEQAEISRKDEIYYSAKIRMKENTILSYQSSIGFFRTIRDWKDSEKQIEYCREKIEEIQAKEEADRKEKERREEERRIAAEKASKKRKKTIAIIFSIVCVALVLFFLLTKVIIPNNKYSTAKQLKDEGKYEEAIAAFEKLNGYKDSLEQIAECRNAILDLKYNAAIKLKDEGKYEEAIVAFEKVSEYKDSWKQIAECRNANLEWNYNTAIKLRDEGKYEEAIDIFIQLKDYKDSEELLEKTTISALEKRHPNISVGSIIEFGEYEQDNDTANGNEQIEWVVLAIEGNKALIISRYALDYKLYNQTHNEIRWENCSLREWLNGSFYNSAFSSAQKQFILETSYDKEAGNDAKDMVFVLSYKEASTYFVTDSDRVCQNTAYCSAQGAYNSADGYCNWWLRSPSLTSEYPLIDSSGILRFHGFYIDYSTTSVRPAMWIKLED